MIRLAIILGVLALAVPAGAQGLSTPRAQVAQKQQANPLARPAKPQKQKAPRATLADLSDKIDAVDLDDLAYAIAVAPVDDLTVRACLNGIQALVQTRRGVENNAGLPQRPRVTTIFEYVKVRGLQKALQPGSAIRTACAPLAEEARTSVLQLITGIVSGTAAEAMPLL